MHVKRQYIIWPIHGIKYSVEMFFNELTNNCNNWKVKKKMQVDKKIKLEIAGEKVRGREKMSHRKSNEREWVTQNRNKRTGFGNRKTEKQYGGKKKESDNETQWKEGKLRMRKPTYIEKKKSGKSSSIREWIQYDRDTVE